MNPVQLNFDLHNSRSPTSEDVRIPSTERTEMLNGNLSPLDGDQLQAELASEPSSDDSLWLAAATSVGGVVIFQIKPGEFPPNKCGLGHRSL